MFVIKFIIVLIIVIWILKIFLLSIFFKSIIVPITNKKIKNSLVNLMIIYRINYFRKMGKCYEINKDIYNKLLAKEELRKEELKILNRYI